jgi:hypothetical protein
MRVTISWTTHDRRYTIGLEQFLKTLGLDIKDEDIKAAAKKLLEQREAKQE